MSAELFAKVRTLRQLQGISAQELADRMTVLGHPISRGQLANGETGRVKEMSVDFADHAARALNLTLIQLLTEPAECPTCKGEPPAGFTCNACGHTQGGSR
ncbi:hypothetical protein ADL02_19680 [Streptomyces sp. NRRL WC-3723]|nr:hypothetical protein ADL02_19680 [Streptomyces sp. NRRL WC-3723]